MFSFPYYGLFKPISFSFDLQSFFVTLFAWHLMIKNLEVLDLAIVFLTSSIFLLLAEVLDYKSP